MKQTTRSGFTLIELLIVIGILGILAVGLLAAVDPFEQLKKGRDTNMRNSLVEFHNALIRYYATHGDLPWADTGSNCEANAGNFDISSTGSTTVQDLIDNDCILDLIDDGELKEGFDTALGDNAEKMVVTSDSAVSVRVCFIPESKSIYNDDTTKFDENGDNLAACAAGQPKDVEDQTCYWCAK